MVSYFRNHFGLFVRDRGLFALRFFADDIFKRPQFALDGAFPVSWEGHDPWDRKSAIFFDVWGFSEADDGSLDLGNTYGGMPLEFKRTRVRNNIFSTTNSEAAARRACVDLYLTHLHESDRLTLIDDVDHPIVRGVLESFDPEDRAPVQDIFAQLGFVSRKPVRVVRAPIQFSLGRARER